MNFKTLPLLFSEGWAITLLLLLQLAKMVVLILLHTVTHSEPFHQG